MRHITASPRRPHRNSSSYYAGCRFNRLRNPLKNPPRFQFDSVTCLKYPFLAFSQLRKSIEKSIEFSNELDGKLDGFLTRLLNRSPGGGGAARRPRRHVDFLFHYPLFLPPSLARSVGLGEIQIRLMMVRPMMLVGRCPVLLLV